MQTFFTDYINLLQERHNEILEVLEGLPSAALDWSPGPDMNSISVLIFHLTGAERYWIGDVAAQDPKERDRDAEFRVHAVEIDMLKKRLTDNLEYAWSTLEKFTIQDLEATRVSTRDGHTFTVAWALLHALEHTTLHLGQIQLTRQLWEQSNSNS
ncbi:MAG TPA: DinB family protein [Anaerolineales bacterium]|nr:DinB family protein [Anaerolineales bacterium]